MTGPHDLDAGNGRDHGGGLDAAVDTYGGTRGDWLDLSTGINPVPYPVTAITPSDWTALPDRNATGALLGAARRFWRVPDPAAILPAPGASSLIARIPALAPAGRVRIATPTYNEHAAAFADQGWRIVATGSADACVIVHPNNPDGRLWDAPDADEEFCVIDESFCDLVPDRSLIGLATRPGTVVLKSFGKFWGLAGLRLGFAIALPDTIARLRALTGPWPVSGPALRVATAALNDTAWADATRDRLRQDAQRLTGLLADHGATEAGGTDLFRLFDVDDAPAWRDRLARGRVWTRIFPYSASLLRVGLPRADQWPQLEHAL